MGRFDGYLICSDIDGTFAIDNEENRRAVRYFTDNGGRFTFATGRLVDHLRQPMFRELLNAPAALCNGGIIYDYDTETILRQTVLPMTEETFRRAVAAYPGPAPTLRLYRLSGEVADSTPFPIKAVCVFADEAQARDFKEYVCRHPDFAGLHVCRAWREGVEFNASTATKGTALDFLREWLGNIHTTVGVGDFENDLPLLAHADVAAAPANAVDSVKAAANILLVKHKEGAIAQLVRLLEERQ